MSFPQFKEILRQDEMLSKYFTAPPLSSILQPDVINAKSKRRQGSAKPAFMNHVNEEPSLPQAKSSGLAPPSTVRGLGRGLRLMSTLESGSTITPGSLATESIFDMNEIDRNLHLHDAIAENPVRDNVYVFDDYDFSKRDPTTLGLPIYNHKDLLLCAIEMNQIIIVQGSTGCGKSTQLPQYIFDHSREKREPVNIVVTQPRRIAAISLADRVSTERNWELGLVVGYQVGLDRKMDRENTLLTYVTTGVLLERLVQKTCNLSEYSHVILDEIHERDVDMDLLMLIVKELLLTNSTTKLVLMSATIAAQKIAQYFLKNVYNETSLTDYVINIDGVLHDVEEIYLDNLHGKLILNMEYFPEEDSKEMPMITVEKKQLVLDILMSITEEEQIENGTDDLSQLNYGSVLIFLPGLSDIRDLHDYLMGIQDPTEIRGRAIENPRYVDFRNKNNSTHGNLRATDVRQRWQIIFLHSSVTADNQKKVFVKPFTGQRKIILSTNIAESSITVPGIKYVIDFCMTKRLRYNRETKFSSLRPEWASQSNLIQRKGRAGRTDSGRVYRLIRKDMFQDLEEFCPPEMLTGPLEKVVLRTKEFGREPISFLSRAIDPPNPIDIGHTLVTLKETGALTVKRESSAVLATSHWEGDLTFIGKVMSSLPVDIHVGKLVALGHIFDVLEDAIILGACMSVNKSIFVSPIQGTKEKNQRGQRNLKNNYNELYEQFLPSYEKKLKFAAGMYSDPIAMMRAYKLYSQALKGGIKNYKKWCAMRHLDHRALAEVEELHKEMKRRVETKLFMACNTRESRSPDFDLFLLKFAIAGAFYPNYFIRDYNSSAEEASTRMFGSKDPARCVQIGNLPMNEGHLYLREVERHFKRHCMRNLPGTPQAIPRDSKMVIEFPEFLTIKDGEEEDSDRYAVSLPVYLALKMRLMPQLKPSLYRVQLTPELQDQVNNIIAQRQHSVEFLSKKKMEKSEKLSRHVGYPAFHMGFIHIIPKFLNDCGKFYGIYKEFEDKEIILEEMIADYFSKNDGKPLANPQPGKLCLALDVNDGCHHRATIKAIERDRGEALIFFVDYGSTYWVSYSSIFDMPKYIDEICPQLAVEFVLCETKPPVNEVWGKKHLDVMLDIVNHYPQDTDWFAEVYSVVNNKVRIILNLPWEYDKHLKTLNEALISYGVADFCEEPFPSRQDHTNRAIAKRSTNQSNSPDFVQSGNADACWTDEATLIENFLRENYPRNQPSDKIRLTGPFHPHEMAFLGLTRAAAGRKVKVAVESVNNIVIDPEPQNPHQRLLVAGIVQSNPHYDDELIIRHTTLMPHIPGLPFLVCTIFAPVVEFRCDSYKTRYTGSICGLGYDTNHYPINPSNDVEVMADIQFDTDDLVVLNDIRFLMSNLLEEWRDHKFLEQRTQLRECIQMVISTAKEKDLTSIQEHYPRKPFHWLQIPEEDIILPNEDQQSTNKLIPYINHCGLDGVGVGYLQLFYEEREFHVDDEKDAYYGWRKRFAQYMINNHRSLERRLNNTTDTNLGQFVVCEACLSDNKKRGVVLYNRLNLQDHLNCSEHVNNVKKFHLILRE